MTGGVAGKVIAVTGVSSGIGRAYVRSLAWRGALVVGIGRRADRGAAIADELRAEGHTMTSVTGDMTVVADCVRFIDAVVAEHGRIDALVNNVGGSGVPTYVPSEQVTPEQFDEGIALNLRSAFFCSTAAVPHMKRQGGGSIVNISSVAGNQAMAAQVVYGIAKAGLDHLTRCLAVEFLQDRIRVNTIIIGAR